MILSIDTTSEWGSIALTDRGELVEEVALHSPDGFGHVLFPQLQQLLERHGVPTAQRVRRAPHDLPETTARRAPFCASSLEDAIDCFAAASGPGSFTGVRVGLAAAKGLAEASGKKVVAVSNLRALATFGTAPLRAVVLDARRGEVYGAVYDDRLNPIVAESVMKYTDWLKTLPNGGFEFIFADGFTAVDSSAPVVRAPRALAAAIGRIAWREFSAGRALDPAAVDANYVRRSDAELFWKDPATRSPSE